MKRILSIDDDESIQKLLKAFLKNKYEVITVGNGHEALEFLRSGAQLPDLILLDMNMPQMDGFTFKRHLDQDPKLKNISVIYLTADDKNSEKVEHANTYDFLNKPIEKEDLLYVIETHFRMKSQKE